MILSNQTFFFISIPYGAIKRSKAAPLFIFILLFQFLMVRLKVTTQTASLQAHI